MATLTLKDIRWARREGGGQPRLVGGPGSIEKTVEAASQSYTKGMLVYLSSGKVTEVAAGNITAAFAGLALEDATGVTDTRAPLLAITEDDVFIANVYHATPASAVTAITQLGARWGLKVVSDKLHVDLELAESGIETTSVCNAWCKIVGFVDPDRIGSDVYAQVYIKIGRRGIDEDGSSQVDFLQFP
jgi:hypothetical protein